MDEQTGRTDPSNMFGRLLRRHRGDIGLTQEELAKRSGISVQAITMLERGVRRSPRTSTVAFLAEALKLTGHMREQFEAAARGEEIHEHLAEPPEPVAGIPPDPSVHFVGRAGELADIGRLLQRNRRLTIHGLGGVGKTQLAARYVHDHRDRYPDGVFWLRADHESSLLGDLGALAWRLRLDEREEARQDRQVEAVLRWLLAHTGWLLVLDNVEPPTDEAMRRWIPSGLAGHTLITSTMPLGQSRLPVDPLPPADAVRLLLQRTRQIDIAAATVVAETLGRLPLALGHAAAYIDATGREMASYGDLLRSRLVELMRERKPDDYPHPLATTWSFSFQRLECERPAAGALLRLCAFLAPDDIPLGVLAAGAPRLPDPLKAALIDDLELDRMIAALLRYSLIDRQGDRLQVHRLVQAVVRESLAPEEGKEWLGAVIRVLSAAFPEEPEHHSESWPLCGRLVAHVQTVNALAGEQAVELAELSSLLARLGGYLRFRAEFSSARQAYERALQIREQVLGPDHPETAMSLSDLAGLLREQGDLAAAGPLHERALAVRQATLGADDPETANSHNNLGWLLRDQGELAAARTHLEQAVSIRQRKLGVNHPRTATSLNNLALLLVELGEGDEAGRLFERALAARAESLGADHPLTAQSLSNLGFWHRCHGDLGSARSLLEQAAAILVRKHGPHHPETARCDYKRAIVLRDLGELAAAEELAERAHATLEQTLGPEHRMTVDARRGLREIRDGVDAGQAPAQ
jgi:tetratricopeptide (TPR) repeat protein/transcriptional regulator with XRE-family HTH domain